jgi:tRNA dimethylallyltransferase
MEELARGDPISAERIHLNDIYRLLRALEVLRLTGRPLSSFGVSGAGAGQAAACRFILVGLSRPREELYRRIDARCAAMFAQGLPDEVRRLYDRGYTPRDPGLRAIGYREFFVRDEDDSYRLSSDISGVQALVAQNSRRYAKRQITFFASLPGVQWIEAGADDAETAERLKEFITTEEHGVFNTKIIFPP